MAKKSRRDKELARLRREVEVLRAQLSASETAETTKGRLVQLASQKGPPVVETPAKPEPAEEQKVTKEPKLVKAPKTQPTVRSVDPKYIKADLLKSGILTLIAFGIIAALTFIL